MAIKYQARIHKAFADHLREIPDDVKADWAKAQEQFPSLQNYSLTIDDSKAKYADILTKSNYEICKFFFLEDESKEVFDFDKPELRTKTVTQVVRSNVNAYKSILNSLSEESDSKYAETYKKMKKDYEGYFAIAVEDCLDDAYGEEYTDFKAKFTADEEAEQQKRQKTKQANAEAKKAEEQQQ